MQPTGRGGPGLRSGVTLPEADQRRVHLCGREDDRLQLICISLGGKHEDLAASARIHLMLSLLLLATVPVLLGVGAGGYAWLRFGSTGLWVGLASAGLAAVLFWALRSAGGTFAEQVLAPIAVYFPALLLGGAVLILRARHRRTTPGIG